MHQFLLRLKNYPASRLAVGIFFIMLYGLGCQKNPGQGGQPTASAYPADVIDKWMTLDIRLFTNVTGIFNGAVGRPFAYAGICAYESIDPGTASWKHYYNELPGLPSTERYKTYHWPSSVNASLAQFNRQFFTTANSKAADIAAIDSLENAIAAGFGAVSAAEKTRSVSFGKSIADAIFAWSNTDSYNGNNAMTYTIPVGTGLWEPTPPAFAKPQGPFWSKDRLILSHSGDGAQPSAPIPYSELPGSAFYKQVDDVYKASFVLTTEQQNMALFWRDIPGVTTPGHWLSIVQQVIKQTHSRLDKAAMTFALVGICMNEAVISVFKTKYIYNQVRPVTYIRKVIGDAAWLSFIPTPAHPEYPSAHSVVSSTAAEALTAVYGNIGSFTDHTWDYLGFPPRTYHSFRAIATDAGNSRFYGGIHYQPSINAGLMQGAKIGDNIVNTLRQYRDFDD